MRHATMRWAMVPLLGWFAGLAGCTATGDQSQAFIAEDPNTGERALYRLEVRNKGIGGVKYQFTAKYLPQTTIDLYEGKIPQSLAELDAAARTQRAAATTVMEEWEKYVTNQAKKLGEKYPDYVDLADTQRANRRAFADLVADATRTLSEMQSISEADSTNPHQFRKLVYFITTKPLTVRDFEGEIQDIEATTQTIASSLIAAREERGRQSAAQRTLRKQKLTNLKEFLGAKPDLKQPDNLLKLIGLMGGF